MLYLSIDQHSMQLTTNLRNEDGDVLSRRQVSTQPKKTEKFLSELRTQAASEGGYAAILEVCGFNDWLIELLHKRGCKEVVLVQPDKTDKRKTDRRDADALGEVLWINRLRLIGGKNVQGIRRVWLPDEEDAQLRQLTQFRQKLGRQLTREINRIHHILFKHNLQHERPTKGMKTKKVLEWLKSLPLTEIDRLEMDYLAQQWESLDKQLKKVMKEIENRQQKNDIAKLIATIPGFSYYSSLVIACRLSDGIERFKSGKALANYWGITPGCNNSGKKSNRLGAITKAGSSQVRSILGTLVTHVVRKDKWMKKVYQKIKQKRGAKIARVAVMRKLAVIIWRMVQSNVPYRTGGPEMVAAQRELLNDLKSGSACRDAAV